MPAGDPERPRSTEVTPGAIFVVILMFLAVILFVKTCHKMRPSQSYNVSGDR